MNDFTKFDATLGVSDVYVKAISDLHKIIRVHTTIHILVVVDGGISLTEAPSGFGVGRVVRLLRESHIGCTHFSVDLARRNNVAPSTNNSPAPHEPRYTGFRFDQLEGGQPIVNKYHEVWCFGFNPDNAAGPDSNITQAGALPTSDAELKVLTQWMNDRQGGLLAMGDHDYLGASMCHRIPRIRSMRRWTNAQGVPPIGGALDADTHLRHDTNQPATPGQINAGAPIPFSNQEDSTPQPIDWVPWISQLVSIFKVIERPHPILCHPTHGPINVMPDHPHEGWCFEDDEIDLTATYGFLDLTGDEYPTVSGQQPQPRVIAHGTTTPNPPFNLEKGPSPRKRFAMISVYDGHPANVGRVATDSTWHHWFDENLQEIEAAGGTNWDKISRYFLNVATWLAPPGVPDWCIIFEIVRTHFTYLGFQEYSLKSSIFDLGKALHTHLIRYLSPCWVTHWVFDKIRLVDDDIWAWLKDRLFWKDGIPVPGGDPCLSCPPFELVEIAVLGGLVRASFPVADEIKAHVDKKPDRPLKMDAERIIKQQLEGVEIGLQEFRGVLTKSIKEMKPLLR
ncbi:MAG: hypothetical protein ACREX9_12840 [Gammaproteobacteria bacterium]